MKGFRLRILLFLILLVWAAPNLLADSVTFGQKVSDGKKELWLSNSQIQCSVVFENGKIAAEMLEAREEWLTRFQASSLNLKTDADFMVEVLWAGWKVPKKINNADNLLKLSKADFKLENYFFQKLSGGAVELDMVFKGQENPFELQMTYRLEPGSFYLRRRIAVREAEKGLHLLRWFWPRYGFLFGEFSIIKPGGFGQPAVIRIGEGGGFFGLEYPTAENSLKICDKEKAKLQCGQEMGEKIGSSWVKSEWVVVGLSPNSYVKQWFWKYVDRIRVAPLKPYLLYNSWYDLRAPEMVKNPARAMTEENVLRTIASFRKRLFDERGLHLDAFVLDDGWDIYRSDWVLNKEQFPNGFFPFVKDLQGMKTKLGLWLGPIGGYSHRDWRVEWMKVNGYEVVGNQMCVAGKRYHQLLKECLTNFVRSEDVSYYKWDGIQFACNEVNHGHLPDIYSRRAVMESVIDLCQSVREEKPDIFLNITSGTWLSPWWLKYANTIWMQGYDYGYANVPSLSRRDRAMTYRDSVLFDDLKKLDFWFPIANLMTHGIIKGHLQPLGGEEEPLEKFIDNAILYFARGISMWELYISPDFLTDDEWDVLAEAIRWAKDRFPLLCSTEMIGGDPDDRKAYGYVHFSGKNGLVAVRNPFIEPQTVRLKFSESLGLDADADSLVLERVYPTHWVSPELYSTGSVVDIPLQGYETAIYEIYPLEEATIPLLAGRVYKLSRKNEREIILTFYEGREDARLLNPAIVKAVNDQDKTIIPEELTIPVMKISKRVEDVSLQSSIEKGISRLDLCFTLKKPIQEATLAILLEPDKESLDKKDPIVTLILNEEKSQPALEHQKGRWAWYMVKVPPGKHSLQMHIFPAQEEEEWKGLASVWLICSEKLPGNKLTLIMKQDIRPQQPMPPHPWPEGEIRRNIKLGEIEVRLQNN